MEAEGLLAPVDITLPIGFLPGEFTRYLTPKKKKKNRCLS